MNHYAVTCSVSLHCFYYCHNVPPSWGNHSGNQAVFPWRTSLCLAVCSQFLMLLHSIQCKGWAITNHNVWAKPTQLSLYFSLKNTVADYLFCFSSVLYLEGAVLVFEDVFKLVAFYCVSRWVGLIASILPPGLPLPMCLSHNRTTSVHEFAGSFVLGKAMELHPWTGQGWECMEAEGLWVSQEQPHTAGSDLVSLLADWS